jgi:hypothetical protein
VSDSGYEIQDSGQRCLVLCRIELRVKKLGFRVKGFIVWSLDLRGLGFMV